MLPQIIDTRKKVASPKFDFSCFCAKIKLIQRLLREWWMFETIFCVVRLASERDKTRYLVLNPKQVAECVTGGRHYSKKMEEDLSSVVVLQPCMNKWGFILWNFFSYLNPLYQIFLMPFLHWNGMISNLKWYWINEKSP